MHAVEAANTFIDFFLPRFCLSCNSKLPSHKKIICDECLTAIQHADKSRISLEYEKKFAEEGIIDGFSSAFVFQADGNLQKILHEFKYKMRFRIGNFLGQYLTEIIKEEIAGWNVDFIIPMPIHRLRKAERGYNQADYIAKTFGKNLNIPVKRKIAKRIKFTQSQTKLNLVERKDNMKGAFKITNKKQISDTVVLILDDVITTGATVAELGRELKANGVAKVYTCSVAIAD